MNFVFENNIKLDYLDPVLRIVSPMRYSQDIGSFGLTYGVFVPTIKFLGTDEQAQKWVTLADKLKIIGAYSQTELGHGSDVQRI